MVRRAITAAFLASSLVVIGCNKNQPEITGPTYLYATPGSLTVVAGRDTSAAVAGGSAPVRTNVSDKHGPRGCIDTAKNPRRSDHNCETHDRTL